MKIFIKGNLELNYAINTTPNPIQASDCKNLKKAQIAIIVSNGGDQSITCTEITFGFTIGSLAQNLTNNGKISCNTGTPDKWNIASDGNGNFTATPKKPKYGIIAQDGIDFNLFNIEVNDQVGSFEFFITETILDSTKNPKTNNGNTQITKFPSNFEVSNLTITPQNIKDEGDVTLSWNGSSATYYLSWMQDSSVKKIDVSNQNTYPNTAKSPPDAPLLIDETTIFNLNVSTQVNGETYLLTRQVTGEVYYSELELTSFSSNPPMIVSSYHPNDINLTWSFNKPHSTVLKEVNLITLSYDDNSIDVTGLDDTISLKLSPPHEDLKYTLNVHPKQGNFFSKTLTVPVYQNLEILSFDGIINATQIDLTWSVNNENAVATINLIAYVKNQEVMNQTITGENSYSLPLNQPTLLELQVNWKDGTQSQSQLFTLIGSKAAQGNQTEYLTSIFGDDKVDLQIGNFDATNQELVLNDASVIKPYGITSNRVITMTATSSLLSRMHFHDILSGATVININNGQPVNGVYYYQLVFDNMKLSQPSDNTYLLTMASSSSPSYIKFYVTR